MKVYQNPVSTTCRPIMMFIADEGLEVEQQIVDIMAGEQYGEAFTKINPNNFVPVLEDGDFKLLESSAILKYLAEKCGSAAYPTDPQARARVNEVMDWFNTSFYRTFGYGLVYSQVLDNCKLPDDAAHKLQVSEGKAQAERFLSVLNDNILGRARPGCAAKLLRSPITLPPAWYPPVSWSAAHSMPIQTFVPGMIACWHYPTGSRRTQACTNGRVLPKGRIICRSDGGMARSANFGERGR